MNELVSSIVFMILFFMIMFQLYEIGLASKKIDRYSNQTGKVTNLERPSHPRPAKLKVEVDNVWIHTDNKE